MHSNYIFLPKLFFLKASSSLSILLINSLILF